MSTAEIIPMNYGVSAPGKIILYGEHSVVYGKNAVALSLNLRTVLRLETNASFSCVKLNIPAVNELKTWTVEEITNVDLCSQGDVLNPVPLSSEDHWKILDFLKADKAAPSIADRIAVALIFLYKNIFSKVSVCPGMTIEITSSLPFSAGLGSSASVAVCLSAALLRVSGVLSIGNRDDPKSEELHLSQSDLDLINQWSFMIEKIFHGSPSGIDNNTCTFGGAIVYKNGEFSPMKVGLDLKILVVNSMISRNTKEMVSRVRSRLDKYPSIINPILESMDHIAIKAISLLQKSNPSDDHYQIFEDLIDINQALLTALGVSHPKIQEIASIADRHGFCAKLTGAGGGGVVFILLKPGLKMEQLELLKEDLEKRGFQHWEVAVGGNGVQIIS